MWESQPGLSCSRVVARGQQGPHEEPKRQQVLSVHLSPRSGEVRRAPWCHRMHLHPGNRVGIASRGKETEMVEMMKMMEMQTGTPVPAGLP